MTKGAKNHQEIELTVEHATWLIDRDGSLVEAVLDRGTVRAGGGSAKFHEIDLELGAGDPPAMFGFAEAPAEDSPLEIGVLSTQKLALLLASGGLDHEQKAREPALTDDLTTAQAFAAVVQECIRHFRLNQALIITERDPAALHQARVAMRRLRTSFMLFGPAIREGAIEPLKADIKQFVEPFGEARNLDVYLHKHGEELSWQDRGRLQSARTESYDRVALALNSQQLRHMLVDLAEWVISSDWQRKTAGKPIGKFAVGEIDSAWNKVKRDGSKVSELEEQQLHRLRINIKKLRYSIEFLAPLYRKKKVRKFAASLEAMQDCLGLIHDDMISREIVAHYGLSVAGRNDISERACQLGKMEKRFKRLKRVGRFWH